LRGEIAELSALRPELCLPQVQFLVLGILSLLRELGVIAAYHIVSKFSIYTGVSRVLFVQVLRHERREGASSPQRGTNI